MQKGRAVAAFVAIVVLSVGISELGLVAALCIAVIALLITLTVWALLDVSTDGYDLNARSRQ